MARDRSSFALERAAPPYVREPVERWEVPDEHVDNIDVERVEEEGCVFDDPLTTTSQTESRPIVWLPNSVRWGDTGPVENIVPDGEFAALGRTKELVRLSPSPIPIRAQTLVQVDVQAPAASAIDSIVVNVVVESGAGSAVIRRTHTTTVAFVVGSAPAAIFPDPIDCGGQYISVSVEVRYIASGGIGSLVGVSGIARVIILPATAAYFQLREYVRE